MMSRLLMVMNVVLLAGCLSIDTECCIFMGSYSVSDSLYVEKYRRACGGPFGERFDYYVTDSVKFRRKIAEVREYQDIAVTNNNGVIHVYTRERREVADTIGRRTVLLSAIRDRHDSGGAGSSPLFGTAIFNYKDRYSCSSYEVENGFYMTTDQFLHKGESMNAVYFTDSSTFNMLIGFYKTSARPVFEARLVNKKEMFFYQIEYRTASDTTGHTIFRLSDHIPGKLESVCKKEGTP